MRLWCGIDWSEKHHDIAVVDDNGRLVAKQRIAESAAGFRELLELLAVHGGASDEPLPIAIETAKGLLPAALRAVGYQLFSINPLLAAVGVGARPNVARAWTTSICANLDRISVGRAAAP